MFELIPFTRSHVSVGNIFDSMARNFFGDFDLQAMNFRSDILDKGDKYLLQAELPGFNREDIRLELDGDTLTITAEHSESNDAKQDNYLRRERSYGSFTRTFDVSSVKTDEIAANYQNGVLELALPKKAPAAAPEKRQIEIK